MRYVGSGLGCLVVGLAIVGCAAEAHDDASDDSEPTDKAESAASMYTCKIRCVNAGYQPVDGGVCVHSEACKSGTAAMCSGKGRIAYLCTRYP